MNGNATSVSELFGRSAAEIAGPAEVLLRLVLAALLGGVVALVYRRSRFEPASSFTATLVLLSILIAMVTQVVGDNVARAFSLVGALSIVRFRTVVRDTQDTAYVIFAVAIGCSGFPGITTWRWAAAATLAEAVVATLAERVVATLGEGVVATPAVAARRRWTSSTTRVRRRGR